MDNIADSLADLRGRVDVLVKVCTALLAAQPDARALLALAGTSDTVRRDQPVNSRQHYYINGMRAALDQIEDGLELVARSLPRDALRG
jgi:hypothetical protein